MSVAYPRGHRPLAFAVALATMATMASLEVSAQLEEVIVLSLIHI